MGTLIHDKFRIASFLGPVVRFQIRRCATQDDRRTVSVGPYLGNKAGVVARPFFLLVGTFVFFIDDDKSQILERTKNGTPNPNQDAGLSVSHPVPDISPFRGR